MSGSTTLGMGIGTVGLGWSGMAGALGLVDLVFHPEVYLFQGTYDSEYTSSQSLPVGQRLTGGMIDTDGKYAGETHGALKKYVNWLVLQGRCYATDSSEIDRLGPNAARACLVSTGLNDATVSGMQQAWNEWRASTGGDGGGERRPAPTDPYASSRTACAASGGTWSDVTHTCTAAPPASSEGLSTGMWLLLALVGALAAYGIYYVATEG